MRPTLISADSHVLEPPDLWTERVPQKYRERAPRMERFPQGDAWVMEGAIDPINFGLNQCAGIPAAEQRSWIPWEDARKAGYDAAVRVQEMDADGVDAEILYPTPRVANTLWWNSQEPDFHIAMIRAYNDWLSEFCSAAPDRLKGLALMPSVGVDAALAEFERSLKLPGIDGINIGQYPSGGVMISPEDDRFWAAAVDARVPVSIHVSLATEAPGDHSRKQVTGEFKFFDPPLRALQFMRAGVFDRYPDLSVVFAEVDCGWVPYVIQRLDDMYQRTGPGDQARSHQHPPSHYFHQNVSWVYVSDPVGIEMRDKIGVSQIMWSSDFPHRAADWPRSWDTIERHFVSVPEDEKEEILGGNAARVYGLDRATAAQAAG